MGRSRFPVGRPAPSRQPIPDRGIVVVVGGNSVRYRPGRREGACGGFAQTMAHSHSGLSQSRFDFQAIGEKSFSVTPCELVAGAVHGQSGIGSLFVPAPHG